MPLNEVLQAMGWNMAAMVSVERAGEGIRGGLVVG